jgi:hypothetical protein
VGPQGEKGDKGDKGNDGANGQNGAAGRDGANGTNGRDGKDGAPGKDGVNGTNGVDGKNGADGKNGIDGKDGKDGVNGVDGRNGIDGRDGKDGLPGSGVRAVSGNEQADKLTKGVKLSASDFVNSNTIFGYAIDVSVFASAGSCALVVNDPSKTTPPAIPRSAAGPSSGVATLWGVPELRLRAIVSPLEVGNVFLVCTDIGPSSVTYTGTVMAIEK